MNRLLRVVIILSGLFFYKMMDEYDRFYPAQFIFFVTSALVFLGYLVYKKNNLMGYLCWLFSFGFFKTSLMQHAPPVNLYDSSLLVLSIFILYYFLKNINISQDIFKLFLIPACLNIGLVIIQALDNNFLSFMPVKGIGGFLGNSGIISCYLGVTTPIFIKYFKKGLPFLMLAVILTRSFVGMFACLTSGLAYLYLENRKSFNFKKMLIFSFIIFTVLFCIFRNKFFYSIHIRASTFVGTLDGIKHNPILGWGLGSYEPIMTRVGMNEQMKFLGIRFSYFPAGIMHHPHNELLSGWWHLGILCPILILLYAYRLIMKKNKNNLSFSILLGFAVISMFYFLSPPAIFLLIFTLVMYETTGGENAYNESRL